MKNDQKLKHDYEKSLRKFDINIPIPCAWGVDSDWNSFLGMSATCLDRNEDLKQALEVFSVLKILAKNASLLLSFGRSLGLVCASDPLPMCYVTCFDKNYGLIMPCLHVQDSP